MYFNICSQNRKKTLLTPVVKFHDMVHLLMLITVINQYA